MQILGLLLTARNYQKGCGYLFFAIGLWLCYGNKTPIIIGVVWNLPLSIQGVYSQFCEFLRKFARLNQPKGGVYKPQDEALLTAYDSLTPRTSARYCC